MPKRRKHKAWRKIKMRKEGTCFYCGKIYGTLPYRCKFCGNLFCSDHHLPENHDCEGLKEHKRITQERFREKAMGGIKEIRRRPWGEKPRFEPSYPSERTYTGPTPVKTPLRKRFRVRIPRFARTPLFILGPILIILLIEFLFVKNLFYPTIYILVGGVAGWLVYILFIKASRIRAGSDLRIFGLKILSALVGLAGALLAGFWMVFIIYQPIFFQQISLDDPKFICASVFILVFGFGLLLLGAFLYFRFMRKAGIIIFPR